MSTLMDTKKEPRETNYKNYSNESMTKKKKNESKNYKNNKTNMGEKQLDVDFRSFLKKMHFRQP